MIVYRFVKRGISEAIGVVIAFTIISIAMLYILLSILSSAFIVQGVMSMPSGYANEKLVLFVAQNRLIVKNVGSTTSYISYIVIVDSNLNKFIVRADQTNLCTISPSLSISPGDIASITCLNHTAVAVATKSGRVFAIDPRFYAMAIERAVAIPVKTVYGGIMLTSTSGLLKFLEDPKILTSGAINTSISLSLIANSSGDVNGWFRASLVFIGKNPVNNKLNVLAIGYGESGTYINIRGSSYLLNNVAPYRYRLKIENFTGSINLGLGIHPCYINTSSTCSININGVADRILLYGATSFSSMVIGLDPYMFVGDIDNNSNIEIIFVTQDFSIGNRNNVNDRFSLPNVGTRNYIDSSITPIRIIFSETPVDSMRYSSAILSIKMFFWDNSEDDISNNDNRVIMRVGLYDGETKEFIYSTYLSYYELNRYRHVKPFVASYISKDFTIYIPDTGKSYYVAIEFLDPFYLEGNRNDADLIIGLEYIGIALASRR